MLPGSPQDFLAAIVALDAHKALAKKKARRVPALQRAMDIASSWDISSQLWEREWSNLSGGEAQRIALAIALGLDTAEVLLLDGMRCSRFFRLVHIYHCVQNRRLRWIRHPLSPSKSIW